MRYIYLKKPNKFPYYNIWIFIIFFSHDEREQIFY